jgi:choline-sulfatase
MPQARPNVLVIMADNQRHDTIAALGNPHIHTPNLDRLVRRGLAFDNAYSPCPVCVPARYAIRTGCEPPTTRCFGNAPPKPAANQPGSMEERCGEYLAKAMCRLGYRTFGIGKFHAMPWNEDLGYEVMLQSHEMYQDAERRRCDAYASWIASKHPEYDFIEMLMGERAEMFYMPQMRPMPANVTAEWWTAERAIEQIKSADERPYFGFVSFIAPHPPFAPPIPFNRMYDPDRMPNPICGEIATDYMDDSVPSMTHALWAEDMAASRARVLKARYYGSISHMDHCLGRILNAVEARRDADNTLIVFCSDHGDHLGDHHAWHLGSLFDTTCRIPFLVSWPARLPAAERRAELVSLTDIFGLTTGAAGSCDRRQGMDILGVQEGRLRPREVLFAYGGMPGGRGFKMMGRDRRYKYIYLANGGREQLFDLQSDPHELRNLAAAKPDIVCELRRRAIAVCRSPGARDALEKDDFRTFEFKSAPPRRICQFDRSRGVAGFQKHPGDVLAFL